MATPNKGGKMPTSDEVGIRIGFLIHDVSRLRRTVYDCLNPNLVITRSESWVLTGVSRKSSGMSQTELARVLGLSKTATGDFIKALQQKGFVTRVPDRQDQRAYLVQLTRSGRTILNKIAGVVTRMNAEVFRNFTLEELDQFASYLKKMKLQLNSMTETAASPGSARKSRVAIRPRRRK